MKLRTTMKVSAIFLLTGTLLCSPAFADDEDNTASGTQTTTITTESTTDTSTPAAVSGKNSPGAAFLLANKSKPGVITTPDGLQYKVLKTGTGAKPTDTDIVSVNYEGKLLDGTVFDSSYKRGEAATFPVNGVIAGWTEALKLMNVGSTYELYIPAQLAYGETGAPPNIGPNETLIFKVELLGIVK